MTDKKPNADSHAANQSFGEIELAGGGGQNLSLDSSATPKANSDKPPQAFGELDLGGEDDDPIPSLGGQDEPKKDQPKKIRRAPMGKPPAGQKMTDRIAAESGPGLQTRPRPPRAKPKRQEPEFQLPRRSYKKPILITLLVLVVLGAIGAGVYGFITYKEKAEAAKQAEMDQINQGSLDALKRQAVTQGQQGL